MKKFVLITIMIFMFSNIAQAGDQFYIGGGVGGTSFSGERSLLIDKTKIAMEDSISGNDFTGKIFGGFRFLEMTAVEIGFHRFGVAHDFSEDIFNTDYHAIGASLSILGFVPLTEDFELFGKIGVLLSKIYSDNPDILILIDKELDSFARLIQDLIELCVVPNFLATSFTDIPSAIMPTASSLVSLENLFLAIYYFPFFNMSPSNQPG